MNAAQDRSSSASTCRGHRGEVEFLVADARPDVTLGLDQVLSVTDGEAAGHGPMVRPAEIERFVTDWEFRECAVPR